MTNIGKTDGTLVNIILKKIYIYKSKMIRTERLVD